jgi:hypothetical protein
VVGGLIKDRLQMISEQRGEYSSRSTPRLRLQLLRSLPSR